MPRQAIAPAGNPSRRVERKETRLAKKSYIAKKAIQHDGELYAEGDPIELDDKTEAPALLAVEAIEPVETKKAAAKA